MKLTYILHSGFLLEQEDKYILFDYYKGDLPEMSPEKPLYVFASHRHHDHFTPDVFKLANSAQSVKYILSDDIDIRHEGAEIINLGAHEKANIDGMTIETLKSTDEGVAFLVTSNDTKIYFAGDLNLWVWDDESEEYNTQMTKAYLAELDKIAGRTFDIAFLPIDPRQEGDRDNGALEFLRRCPTRHIVPMHFWGEHFVIDSFKRSHPEYAQNVLNIKHEGEQFDIN